MRPATSFLILAVVLAGIPAPSPGEEPKIAGVGEAGWAVVECPAEIDRVRSEYFEAVRTAREGAAVYPPHPFPVSREQILEDYLDSLRRNTGWRGPSTDAASVRDEYRRVLNGVTESEVAFEIVRVEEWRESRRCSADRPRDFYYIVRVFERGEETLRGIVLDSGVVVGNDLGGDEGFPPLSGSTKHAPCSQPGTRSGTRADSESATRSGSTSAAP